MGRLRQGNSKREAALGLAWGAQIAYTGHAVTTELVRWRFPSKELGGSEVHSEDFILSLAEAPGHVRRVMGCRLRSIPHMRSPGSGPKDSLV